VLFCFFHDDDRPSGRPKDAAAGPEPAGAITPVCGVPVCSCPRKCRCLLDPDSTGRGAQAQWQPFLLLQPLAAGRRP